MGASPKRSDGSRRLRTGKNTAITRVFAHKAARVMQNTDKIDLLLVVVCDFTTKKVVPERYFAHKKDIGGRISDICRIFVDKLASTEL